MDTVTGQAPAQDERALLDLQIRSDGEIDRITAHIHGEQIPPAHPAYVAQWVTADLESVRQLSPSSLNAARDIIARNVLASNDYADELAIMAPPSERLMQVWAFAHRIAHLVATHLPLKPDTLRNQVADWPADVAAFFRAPAAQQLARRQVNRLLQGIDPDSLSSFERQVGAIIAAPASDADKSTNRDAAGTPTAWVFTYDEQVRHVARVINTNANLLAWKVEANLKREPAGVIALLSDKERLRILEHDVMPLLAVPPERMAATLSIVERGLERITQAMQRQDMSSGQRELDPLIRQRAIDLDLVADFIASSTGLTPDTIAMHARYAKPELRSLLGNAERMRELNHAIDSRLSHIPADRIADVQAFVAEALGRDDALQRADAARILHEPPSPTRRPDQPSTETVQRTIDFLATCATLHEQKIPDKIATAPADVKTLLADADQVKALDSTINDRLSHLLPERLASVHAIIAATLQRPDAPQREQVARTFSGDQRHAEHPPADAASPALAAQSPELAALAERFHERIRANPAMQNATSDIALLQDRISARHRLYDDLAILTRMERGEEIMGAPGNVRSHGILPDAVMDEWLQQETSEIRTMVHLAGDRLGDAERIRSALGKMQNVAARDEDYEKALQRIAPDLREEVRTSIERAEVRAVADFISANQASPAWKLEGNLERAAPALKALLADTGRMQQLDAAIQAALPALTEQQIVAIHATIAGALQRPDYGERLAAAAQGNTPAAPRPESMPRHPPTPTVPAQQPASADAADVDTAATTIRNGIVPSSAVAPDNAPVVKKLLDDMGYKALADGSVLYQVQGRDAFIDHGDQLLMVKGAENEERSILGALLLAKEKYFGTFELTGSEAFKRAAIEIIVNYKLDIRLKVPEQDLMHRQLAAKPLPTAFPAATPQRPVKPANLAAMAPPTRAASAEPASKPAGEPAKASSEPAPGRHAKKAEMPQPLYEKPAAPEDTPAANTVPATPTPIAAHSPPIAEPVDRLSGTLMHHGADHYQHDARNDMSYFVELKNSDGQVHKHWGVGLRDALNDAAAQTGDQISLARGAKKPVTVEAPVRDATGSVTGTRPIETYRNQWRATVHVPDGAPGHSAHIPSRATHTESEPVSRMAGRLVEHGHAPLKNAKEGKPSYFVQVQNADGQLKTFWGLDLERALTQSGAKKGDELVLHNLGRKAMQVDMPKVDDAGNITGLKKGISHRNQWEISATSSHAAHAPTRDIPDADASACVAMREAAWWERQLAFVMDYVKDAPELISDLGSLGARPPPGDIAWINADGKRQVITNDLCFAALSDRIPGPKALLQIKPVIDGGKLDGHPGKPALSLVRGADGYLQGVAQVEGRLRHVIALLPCDSIGEAVQSNGPIPLMAAVPTASGMAWNRIGEGELNATQHDAHSDQAPAMRFRIGRETVTARVNTAPGEPLYERLGFAPAATPASGKPDTDASKQSAAMEPTTTPDNAAPKRHAPAYA